MGFIKITIDESFHLNYIILRIQGKTLVNIAYINIFSMHKVVRMRSIICWKETYIALLPLAQFHMIPTKKQVYLKARLIEWKCHSWSEVIETTYLDCVLALHIE